MAFLKPDEQFDMNGVTVNKFLLTEHNPNNIAMPQYKIDTCRGVTIHNTPKVSISSSTTQSEQHTRATYNGNLKDVRVHFYVDEVSAWQNLPLDLSGWHAADGNGDGNRRTIAIECIMSPDYTESDKKSEDNCARMAAYLLVSMNMDITHLFTHNDWYSKKYCPAYILPHWNDFKNKVQHYMDELNGKKSEEKPVEKKVYYRVRKAWNDKDSQIGAYTVLENAIKNCKEGYLVFDESGKVVYGVTNTIAVKPTETVKEEVVVDEPMPNIYYRVYCGGKWRSEITNCNDTSDFGYAGVETYSIRGLCAKSDKLTINYRVHVVGGGWLNWISKYDPNNWNNGCAGIQTKQIDAIQFRVVGDSKYDIKYRTSLVNSNKYNNWITGYNETDDMGYSGIMGKAIDKIQVCIVKK